MVGESTLGGEREKNKQKTENIKTWFSSDFWQRVLEIAMSFFSISI